MHRVKPSQFLQVKIFQGRNDEVQRDFNNFMGDLHESVLIYKVDTDTDNGHTSKITVYLYADKEATATT